jgi:6-phosphogluconolactonase
MRNSLIVCILFSCLQSATAQTSISAPVLLYVGTYTNTGKSVGIYCYSFDTKTGVTSLLSKTSTASPSYLTISKDQQYLYAVNQLGDKKGGVSAFKLNADKTRLTFLNSAQFGSNGPCYITTDTKGRFVFTANYNDGYLKAFPIQKDGSLDTMGQLIQHYGKSIVPVRQDGPHVHSTVLSPDNKYLLVQDLQLPH